MSETSEPAQRPSAEWGQKTMEEVVDGSVGFGHAAPTEMQRRAIVATESLISELGNFRSAFQHAAAESEKTAQRLKALTIWLLILTMVLVVLTVALLVQAASVGPSEL